MSKRGRTLPQGRWRAIALSVVLHTGIVAAAVYGWFTWKHRPPPSQGIAIEATVVEEKTLKGIAPAPAPQPPPPEPEPEPEPPPPEPEPEEQGPPKPDPAEIERKQEEERLAQEKLEQEQQAREQERLEAEKKEAEKQAAAKAAAEKAAAEKTAADKKAQEKKKAEEAAAAKKAAEEKVRQQRETDLRRMLEAEERGNALMNSEAADRWRAQISARITRAWIKPPSAQPGVTCIVSVRQTSGGVVTAARVLSCNVDDAALRESLEAAAFRASPLPPPTDPALFQSDLEITFSP